MPAYMSAGTMNLKIDGFVFQEIPTIEKGDMYAGNPAASALATGFTSPIHA